MMAILCGQRTGSLRGQFENMPSDNSMAFVLVQHLAPTYRSMLADLLGKVAAMPVVEAEDSMPAEANRFYVIPP